MTTTITFKKNFNIHQDLSEYAINITRLPDKKCNIKYIKGNKLQKEYPYSLMDVQSKLKNYNEINTKNRDLFNGLYKNEMPWNELSRIIGITNYMGHFCIDFDSETFAQRFLNENFNEFIKGFTFVDWTRVQKSVDDKETDTSNQLLYVSSNALLERYDTELNESYRNGQIGCIELYTNDTPIQKVFFVTSKNLNEITPKTPMVKSIISEINNQLRRKFNNSSEEDR